VVDLTQIMRLFGTP